MELIEQIEEQAFAADRIVDEATATPPRWRIRDVVLCGEFSKNKGPSGKPRRYTQQTQEEARQRFAGININFDHPNKEGRRESGWLRSRAGITDPKTIKVVHEGNQFKTKADVLFVKAEDTNKAVALIQLSGKCGGMSLTGDGEFRKNTQESYEYDDVVSLKPNSVDIVDNSATTNGMFEQVLSPGDVDLTNQPLLEALKKVVEYEVPCTAPCNPAILCLPEQLKSLKDDAEYATKRTAEEDPENKLNQQKLRHLRAHSAWDILHHAAELVGNKALSLEAEEKAAAHRLKAGLIKEETDNPYSLEERCGKKMKRLVRKLIKKGKSEDSAYAIATAATEGLSNPYGLMEELSWNAHPVHSGVYKSIVHHGMYMIAPHTSERNPSDTHIVLYRKKGGTLLDDEEVGRGSTLLDVKKSAEKHHIDRVMLESHKNLYTQEALINPYSFQEAKPPKKPQPPADDDDEPEPDEDEGQEVERGASSQGQNTNPYADDANAGGDGQQPSPDGQGAPADDPQTAGGSPEEASVFANQMTDRAKVEKTSDAHLMAFAAHLVAAGLHIEAGNEGMGMSHFDKAREHLSRVEQLREIERQKTASMPGVPLQGASMPQPPAGPQGVV